jgi:hypothetical protein
LTDFFELNKRDESAKNLLYHQVSQFFVWNKVKLTWTSRLKPDESIVGRMYFVHPADYERYYLRILLLYRKGNSSFEQLRTVDGVTHNTYRETCIALGFANDDNEWKMCLAEASLTSSAKQLRELFVLLLLNCAPTNPRSLWDEFKNAFSEDTLFAYRVASKNFTMPINDEVYNICLNEINKLLEKSGSHLNKFPNMPAFHQPFNFGAYYRQSNLILEELDYDAEELKKELKINLPKLNSDQRKAYDAINHRVNLLNEKGNNVFFIDGPGGT